MQDPEIIRVIKDRYRAISAQMDERSRRRWAAKQSQLFGWGGISAVSKATGISPNTIRKGLAELNANQEDLDSHSSTRLRKPGAGRKPFTVTTPHLLTALDHLICDSSPDGSSKFIKWTCKNPAELAAELSKSGLNVSGRTVGRILKSVGYSCPVITRSKAILARTEWPQRFLEIDRSLDAALKLQQPVIAISARRRQHDENSTADAAPDSRPVDSLSLDDVDAPNDPARTLSSPSPASRRTSKAMPSMKITDRVLKEIELAVKHAWESIDKQTRACKSELLILAEFFLSDPLLRSLETNLLEQLKLPIRCLSMPPAIRKWNPLNQQIIIHRVDRIDHDTDRLNEMTLQVIGLD